MLHGDTPARDHLQRPQDREGQTADRAGSWRGCARAVRVCVCVFRAVSRPRDLGCSRPFRGRGRGAAGAQGRPPLMRCRRAVGAGKGVRGAAATVALSPILGSMSPMFLQPIALKAQGRRMVVRVKAASWGLGFIFAAGLAYVAKPYVEVRTRPPATPRMCTPRPPCARLARPVTTLRARRSIALRARGRR